MLHWIVFPPKLKMFLATKANATKQVMIHRIINTDNKDLRLKIIMMMMVLSKPFWKERKETCYFSLVHKWLNKTIRRKARILSRLETETILLLWASRKSNEISLNIYLMSCSWIFAGLELILRMWLETKYHSLKYTIRNWSNWQPFISSICD